MTNVSFMWITMLVCQLVTTLVQTEKSQKLLKGLVFTKSLHIYSVACQKNAVTSLIP